MNLKIGDVYYRATVNRLVKVKVINIKEDTVTVKYFENGKWDSPETEGLKHFTENFHEKRHAAIGRLLIKETKKTQRNIKELEDKLTNLKQRFKRG